MVTNQIDQIGLIFSLGQSPFKRFEIRERSFELLKSFQQDTTSFESVYPFGDLTWYYKDTSGEYHRYVKDRDACESVRFEFPCGLQQFGDHSIVIGATANVIHFCDFV